MSMDESRILESTGLRTVEHHASIGSTNDRAKELAREDCAPTPMLVTADEQTAGRGRGTHRWWTGRGALAASFVVDLATYGVMPRDVGRVSLAVGAALAETLAMHAPEVEIGLHWPNDIVIGNAKAAGVLVEVVAGTRGVLGIGVNTNNTVADAPAELGDRRIASLRDLTGRVIDHADLLIDLFRAIDRRLTQLGVDPAEVMREVDRRCSLNGREVRLAHDGRTMVGVCRGVDESGALLIETPTGVEAHRSGTLSE